MSVAFVLVIVVFLLLTIASIVIGSLVLVEKQKPGKDGQSIPGPPGTSLKDEPRSFSVDSSTTLTEEGVYVVTNAKEETLITLPVVDGRLRSLRLKDIYPQYSYAHTSNIPNVPCVSDSAFVYLCATNSQVYRFAKSTGLVDTNYSVTVTGGSAIIYAMAMDSSGRLYLGGSFTAVNGYPVNHLCRLLPNTTTVDSTWSTRVEGSDVRTLLLNGSKLFLGGTFTSVDARLVNSFLEKLKNGIPDLTWTLSTSSYDFSTVLVTPATIYATSSSDDPDVLLQAYLHVYSTTGQESFLPGRSQRLAFFNGSATRCRIYASASLGSFVWVGGIMRLVIPSPFSQRRYLVQIDTITGLATSYPGLAYEGFDITSETRLVYDLVADPTNNILYVSGSFTTVDSFAPDNFIMRYTAANTSSPVLDATWTLSCNGTVRSLALDTTNGILYMGGEFTSVLGSTRNRLAAVTIAAGTPSLLSWNPNANGHVSKIVLSPDRSTVYAGGLFTTVGGQSRDRAAALNASDGLATAWNPSPNAEVTALAVDNNYAYLGGVFTSPTNYFARVNLTTGALALAGWALDPYNGQVHQIVTAGTDEIFVAGAFTGRTVDKTNLIRNNVALSVLTADTVTDANWNMNCNNTVRCLATDSSHVYVGGSFTQVNGSTNVTGLARVPLSSVEGTVDATFAMSTAQTLTQVAENGSFMYFVGASSVGRCSKANGVVDSGFTPIATASSVTSLLSDGKLVAFGGTFTQASSKTRDGLAVYDVSGSTPSLLSIHVNNTPQQAVRNVVTHVSSPESGVWLVFASHASQLNVNGRWLGVRALIPMYPKIQVQGSDGQTVDGDARKSLTFPGTYSFISKSSTDWGIQFLANLE